MRWPAVRKWHGQGRSDTALAVQHTFRNNSRGTNSATPRMLVDPDPQTRAADQPPRNGWTGQSKQPVAQALEDIMVKLTSEQRRTLERRLTERRTELVHKVRAATEFAKTENIVKVAGEVGDPGDESMAAQLVDLNLAEAQSEVRELRAIEEAFGRLADDTYGYCTECGTEIPYARLEAYPTAERCTECQARHERVYGGRDVTPSL